MRRHLTSRLLGAHLLVLLAVAAAGGLGYWQLQAWQAQRAAEARDLTQLDPVPLGDVMGSDDPFPGRDVGRPVEIEGSWLPDATFYVAGREHDGRDGFWVVTPLTSGAADAPAIPVVRGWVEEVSTAPAPPTGPASLTAWLQAPEGTGVVDEDPSDDVLPQLRIADVIGRVDQDLFGAYGVLDPEQAVTNAGTQGLEPADLDQLPSPGQATGLRNLLYAIEWWFFGAFALFIWWRFVTDELRADEQADEESDGNGETDVPAQRVPSQA